MLRSGDVSALGLAASLLFVALAVALSLRQHLGLASAMAWASARALAQLLLVGLGLALVIDPDQPLLLSWLWIAGMVVFAAVVVRQRAPEVPRLLSLAFTAFALTAAVTIGVLFGLRVFPLEARALVPLGGMVIGNSMNASVVAVRRVVEELRDKRPEVEARLALGQPGRQAAMPSIRAALRIALTPQIETTRAVGIVFLPGAMTGLILAGVDPVDAVLVQAVVMYMILASAAVTTSVVALGLTGRLFTADHRLIDLARTGGAADPEPAGARGARRLRR
ncbi:MAG: ABC transporter permease [Solirubrobacterales bacterium]